MAGAHTLLLFSFTFKRRSCCTRNGSCMGQIKATPCYFLPLIAFRAHRQQENHVVFAWWAAEEQGLLGSRYFVQVLTLTLFRLICKHRSEYAFNIDASKFILFLKYN